MQHLLIQLPYEAKVGSLVQYRWMYHIERPLRYLKPIVGNRARVEVCIVEAFMLKKVAYFTSVYFAEEHNVNAPMSYYSTSKERKAALLYMYADIDGMDKYFE
jgi:hypothetical protein